ncbi:MAG: hypothetical protein ACRCSN_03075 [Dermatophilaceae bacterium]
MNCYLNFLNTTVEFDVAGDAVAAFQPVFRFFRHLMADRPTREPTFRISVLDYQPETDVEPAVWGTPSSIVRRSNAAEFNFDAHVVVDGGRKRYVNRETLVDAPLDVATDNAFTIAVTEKSTVQVLDFVRDLVIRHEENEGTVVLHGSGVGRDGRAVIIAGPKGAGKTTTLLSVLRRPNWTYFTGDKLFCMLENDDVVVYPWRDYPYVGVGTIRSDPRLEKLVRENVDERIDEYESGHKILIDPDLFESWLGVEYSAEPLRLAALLLPEVNPGEPLSIWWLTDENERWAHLNKIVDRQVDTTFFTWQSHLVPDYARFYASLTALRTALDTVEMIRLRGTLDVDLDVLLSKQEAWS